MALLDRNNPNSVFSDDHQTYTYLECFDYTEYIIGKLYYCKPHSLFVRDLFANEPRLSFCVYDEIECEDEDMKQVLKMTFLPKNYLERTQIADQIRNVFNFEDAMIYVILWRVIEDSFPVFRFIAHMNEE